MSWGSWRTILRVLWQLESQMKLIYENTSERQPHATPPRLQTWQCPHSLTSICFLHTPTASPPFHPCTALRCLLINGSASGSATRIQMYLRVLVSWLLRCFLCLCCSLLLSLFDYNLRHSAANICTPPLPPLLLLLLLLLPHTLKLPSVRAAFLPPPAARCCAKQFAPLAQHLPVPLSPSSFPFPFPLSVLIPLPIACCPRARSLRICPQRALTPACTYIIKACYPCWLCY